MRMGALTAQVALTLQRTRSFDSGSMGALILAVSLALMGDRLNDAEVTLTPQRGVDSPVRTDRIGRTKGALLQRDDGRTVIEDRRSVGAGIVPVFPSVMETTKRLAIAYEGGSAVFGGLDVIVLTCSRRAPAAEMLAPAIT